MAAASPVTWGHAALAFLVKRLIALHHRGVLGNKNMNVNKLDLRLSN